jgi:D-alanine-D-alanine ligase
MAGHAKRLFARLGCRDYARFDFRCAADGEPKLMEVNPNPAWANDGKLAFMAGFAGIAYPDMLKMILDAALRRLDLSGASEAARGAAAAARPLRTDRQTP